MLTLSLILFQTNVVPRNATRDAVLTSTTGKDVVIPKNSSIIINITSIHYNDSYWNDASTYEPERFMNMASGKEAEYDASQWLPFALGPRQCPAR